MSNALPAEQFLSPEEYLASESTSLERHEYVGGAIYSMAGTSARHDKIVGNIYAKLLQQLSGGGCEVFSSNLKVGIRNGPKEVYYYPDVVVDCSGVPDESYFAQEPRIIFEVLSPETQRVDRGEKLLNYQTLGSLDAYVLVEQKTVAVIVYRRKDNGLQPEVLTDLSATLDLPTLGCSLPLRAVYERTELLRGSAAA